MTEMTEKEFQEVLTDKTLGYYMGKLSFKNVNDLSFQIGTIVVFEQTLNYIKTNFGYLQNIFLCEKAFAVIQRMVKKEIDYDEDILFVAVQTFTREVETIKTTIKDELQQE